MMGKNSAPAMEVFQYKILALSMGNVLALSAMAGIQGAGYLGICLAALVFLISFHSLWLSQMVARYIRGRNARGQYKSSLKFFRGAFSYALVTGVLLGALLIVGGNLLGHFLARDFLVGFCLIPTAVLFFFYSLSEVVIGYLRGMNVYVPVKIFYIVRLLAGFAGSVVGMKLLGGYGEKVARLKHNEAVTSVYSAFGALSGLSVGSIAGFILLVVFCLLLRREFRAMRVKDNARYLESALHGFQVMASLGMLQGFRYAITFAPLPLNYVLYVRLCKEDGNSAPWIKVGGYLFGEAVPVAMILAAVFLILNHKNFRQASGMWKNEAYASVREKVFAMLLGVVVLVLPPCLAVSTMAEPILKCLSGSAAKEGVNIFLYMGIGAALFVIEMIAYKLMELWNEIMYLYLAVLVSFGAQTAFAVVAFQMLEMDAVGILLGQIVQAAVFVVLFFARFARRLWFSGNQVRKLVMALIVAVAGGLVVLLIYQLIGRKLSAPLALAVSVIPGLLLYLAAVLLLRIVSEEEAEQMPGGGLFLWLSGLLGR